MVKDENYFVVHGWMRTVLGLKGNELTTYAILYGFSQDGESEFRGKLDYISEFSGAHRDTVRATLINLKKKGLVEKVDHNQKTGETNGWICVPLDKIGGCGKITPPLRKNHTPPAENSLPPCGISAPIKNNYKEDYKEIYKEVSKKVSKNIKKEKTNSSPARESYDVLLDNFGVFGVYRDAIFRFIGHLKVSYDLVMLNNRLENLIIRLDMYYRDDIQKAKAIDDAIVRGYKYLECESA